MNATDSSQHQVHSTEDILDVKMPPPPTVIIDETKNEVRHTPCDDIVKDIKDSMDSVESEEEDRPIIPDEDIFPEAPKVKAIKKQRSEKQLAHLKKMRDAKAEKQREKEEWLAEQKEKQKKFVKSEKKEKKAKKKRPPTPDTTSSESEDDTPSPIVSHRPIFHKLTAGEIRAIQRDAISDYETIRKSRKVKEQEAIRRYQAEKKMRDDMQSINLPDADPWASAFNFS